MPTYLYLCEPQNKEFEEYHSITMVLETCPECEKCNLEPHKPKRLICGTTKGVVELYGQDLVDKCKDDVKKMKSEMNKNANVYANMLGEDKYHKLQTKIDRQRK